MGKDLNLSVLLDFYGDMLTDKQRDVMQQYYNDDLSLAEIAANFGITRQGVRDSIKRGEHYLLELESKVGFANKYSVIQRNVEQIARLAKDIGFYNDKSYSSSPEIYRNAQEIVRLTDEIKE